MYSTSGFKISPTQPTFSVQSLVPYDTKCKLIGIRQVDWAAQTKAYVGITEFGVFNAATEEYEFTVDDPSKAASMNIRLVYIYEDQSGYQGSLNRINSKDIDPLSLAGAPDIVADMSPSYAVVNVAATQACGKEIVKVNKIDVIYAREVGASAINPTYTEIFEITSSIDACPIT